MARSTTYQTKQRDRILAFFAQHPQDCFSAQDIIEYANTGVGEATVYRCLAQFAEQGALKRFRIGNRSTYQYAADTACHEHFHLKCVECGALVHMDCDFLRDMAAHIASEHRFDIDPSKTVFYGVCQACRKERKDTV